VRISQQPALNNQRSESRSKGISLPQFHIGLFLAALICLTCIPASAGRKHQSAPTGVDFGDVTVGTSSTQTVVVTNLGHSNATISAANVTGSGFNYMSPALPLTLSRGQSVTLTINFAPSTAGILTGNLSLSASGNVSPNSVPLTGTGVQSQQTLSLTVSPQSVSFGNVPVGSSGSQTVSLLNSGTGPVNVSQATMAGNGFGMTGLAVPMTLGPGQSTAFTVSFAPAGAGSASGNISVVSNAANSVSTVALSGMGVQPQISVAPGSVSFGTVTLGQTSSQTVTLTNAGGANLNITQFAGPGTGFSLSGLALPLTLAPGKSSTFTVSFTPTSGTSSAGSLMLVSNAPTSPTTIPLTGTGSAQVLQVTPSTTSLSFGNQALNASATQSVTLTNTGNAAVSISQVNVAGSGFTLNGSAPLVTLSAGQAASFSVTFTPTTAGSATGSASVVSTAANSPLSISLSGVGVQPQISVAPGSVSFGTVTVGQTSSQTITLTNPGSANLNVTQVGGPGTGFGFTGLAMPLTLAPGKSTAFTVSFTPTSGTSSSSSLTLVSNAPNSPTTIPLTGTGSAQVLQLTPSTTSLSFGSQALNASATQSVTLTNTGNAAVSISQVNVAGSGFTLSGSAPLVTLSAGQAASFSVTFTPTVAGNAAGSASVISTAANSPLSISLSGVGVQPQMSVVPGSVSFGTVTVGQTNSQTITLSNPGTANLNVTQSAGPGTGFGLTGLAMPLTLAPGKSTSFTVSFTPTSGTSFSSSLTLVSNAPNSPTTIPLSGTGLAPVLQLTPSTTSLSFGSQALNASATQSVTLTNTGNAAVSISQVNVTGTGFTLNGSAPLVTLSAGQTASFSVTFTPTVAGSDSGSASVVSTAANSPLSISLTGSGAQPHFVSLAWTESSSGVVGYNVYSSTQPTGPANKLTSTPVGTTAYTDNTVQSGQTYYYWVTALDSSGDESAYSSDVAVTIP
jgi:hypothetical protein